MKPENWVWMPHPAHFIASSDCKFFLSTYVGKFIVSTVGEYLPDSEVRAIFAQVRGIKIEGKGDYARADYMKKIGYEPFGIGDDSFYESMVFRAMKHPDPSCCPWRINVRESMEQDRYSTPEEAQKGHLHLCRKYSKL